MPWDAEETWPGGLGFSGRPVKSGGAGAAAARGEEDARNARGSGWELAGTCRDGAAAAAGAGAVVGCPRPRGGEAMGCQFRFSDFTE